MNMASDFFSKMVKCGSGIFVRAGITRNVVAVLRFNQGFGRKSGSGSAEAEAALKSTASETLVSINGVPHALFEHLSRFLNRRNGPKHGLTDPRTAR